jgi:hypothetical protein
MTIPVRIDFGVSVTPVHATWDFLFTLLFFAAGSGSYPRADSPPPGRSRLGYSEAVAPVRPQGAAPGVVRPTHRSPTSVVKTLIT